jgi:hypothetical protein
MNKIKYNSYVIIFLCLLLSFIIITSFVKNTFYKEPFVPKIIKEKYRPLNRQIRKQVEGFYDKTTTSVSNLFRKNGIL